MPSRIPLAASVDEIMKYDFTDKKTRKKVWVAIILIPSIVISFLLYRNYQLDHYKRKTIGVITEKRPYKSGYDFKASYTVDSYKYNANYSFSSKNDFLESVNIGDTVYIEYSSQDPSIYEFIFK